MGKSLWSCLPWKCSRSFSACIGSLLYIHGLICSRPRLLNCFNLNWTLFKVIRKILLMEKQFYVVIGAHTSICRPQWLNWMRVRLETRRLRVQTPPRSAHSFLEIDHEIFLPSADSRRAVPASVAQLDAQSDWRPGGRRFNPRRGRQHCLSRMQSIMVNFQNFEHQSLW